MKQNKPTVVPEIALQTWLRPELTPVGPNKDYAVFRSQLDAVDRLLTNSHLESMAMDFARQSWSGSNVEQLSRHLRFGLRALRFEVLRMMLGNIRGRVQGDWPWFVSFWLRMGGMMESMDGMKSGCRCGDVLLEVARINFMACHIFIWECRGASKLSASD